MFPQSYLYHCYSGQCKCDPDTWKEPSQGCGKLGRVHEKLREDTYVDGHVAAACWIIPLHEFTGRFLSDICK